MPGGSHRDICKPLHIVIGGNRRGDMQNRVDRENSFQSLRLRPNYANGNGGIELTSPRTIMRTNAGTIDYVRFLPFVGILRHAGSAWPAVAQCQSRRTTFRVAPHTR